MFYALSKILDLALSPLTWAIVLALLGFRRRKKPTRLSRWSPLAAAGILVFFSLEPVSNALVHYLESGAPRTIREDRMYDVVIMMGGVLDERASEDSGELALNENTERMLATYDLLRRGRAKHAIISAGRVTPEDRMVEAQVVADQLVAWGIDRDRVIVEDRARNTRENATYSKKIVEERGFRSVLVVTSAFHMSRSLAAFRGVGLEVDTLPVDPRSFSFTKHHTTWLPRSGFLDNSTFALRELAGRLVYRIVGYGA